MFDFTPTLELVIPAANAARATAAEAPGTTLEDALKDAAEYMADNFKSKSNQIHTGMAFNAELIRIVGTEIIINDFHAMVAAVFDIDAVTYLKLTTGDVIAIQFVVV